MKFLNGNEMQLLCENYLLKEKKGQETITRFQISVNERIIYYRFLHNTALFFKRHSNFSNYAVILMIMFMIY